MFIVIMSASVLFVLMALIGYKLSSHLSEIPHSLYYSLKEEEKYNIRPVYEIEKE